MKPELRMRIIAFNRAVKETGERSSDLEVLISKIAELSSGQLKKVLTEDALEILRKYGVKI